MITTYSANISTSHLVNILASNSANIFTNDLAII